MARAGPLRRPSRTSGLGGGQGGSQGELGAAAGVGEAKHLVTHGDITHVDNDRVNGARHLEPEDRGQLHGNPVLGAPERTSPQPTDKGQPR